MLHIFRHEFVESFEADTCESTDRVDDLIFEEFAIGKQCKLGSSAISVTLTDGESR